MNLNWFDPDTTRIRGMFWIVAVILVGGGVLAGMRGKGKSG
jgi:hypothetical protein